MGYADVVTVGCLPDRLALAGLDVLAVDRELDAAHRTIPTSEGKNFITDVIELGAAWPSPQIDASRMATDSSDRSSSFQPRAAISLTAFSVPTRQGVHWPQLSSMKKRIRLRAASLMSSLSDRITTAAEPMKLPWASSVPKSSGTSPSEAGRMPLDGPPGTNALKVWPGAMPPQNSSISS